MGNERDRGRLGWAMMESWLVRNGGEILRMRERGVGGERGRMGEGEMCSTQPPIASPSKIGSGSSERRRGGGRIDMEILRGIVPLTRMKMGVVQVVSVLIGAGFVPQNVNDILESCAEVEAREDEPENVTTAAVGLRHLWERRQRQWMREGEGREELGGDGVGSGEEEKGGEWDDGIDGLSVRELKARILMEMRERERERKEREERWEQERKLLDDRLSDERRERERERKENEER